MSPLRGGNVTMKVYALGLIVLASAACHTTKSYVQERWWRVYGEARRDEGHSVQQTTDGGYIVTGFINSSSTDIGDVCLIRTDSHGDTLWIRTYGEQNEEEGGNSVRQTADGGYIVAGYTSSCSAGNGGVYLIKTNASGDVQWTRTYGGTDYDGATFMEKTSGGGYIIAGYTYSFGVGTPDYANVYLIKTDGHGDTLWTRAYGGTNEDYANSVQQTTDGGYVVAGSTQSFGAGDGDVYLVKTDAHGDTIWTRTYGGLSSDVGYSVRQTSDGGYIIAGLTSSFGAGNNDVYLIKINAQGDTLWTRTYGGTDDDEGHSVEQTTDGGYIVAGFTGLYGPSGGDVYLIRTNSSGDTLWTRTYGGSCEDAGNSVQQTADGGYVIAGVACSFAEGNGDVYIVKTDTIGNVDVKEP
jgi:hypothetical protein